MAQKKTSQELKNLTAHESQKESEAEESIPKTYNGTDAQTLLAMYDESTAFMQLDWVQKKLAYRWDKEKLRKYVAFYY